MRLKVSMRRVVQFIVIFCFAVLFRHFVNYLFIRFGHTGSPLPWRLTRLQFEATFIGVSIFFALESVWRKVQQRRTPFQKLGA
jgi:hypothetical protein